MAAFHNSFQLGAVLALFIAMFLHPAKCIEKRECKFPITLSYSLDFVLLTNDTNYKSLS